MRYFSNIACMIFILATCACTSNEQFAKLEREIFPATRIMESETQSFVLVNPSGDSEQHIRAIAFDVSSNSAGNFRIVKIEVGSREVEAADIVVPAGSFLKITCAYSPVNLESSIASYGGWNTGSRGTYIPRRQGDKDPNADARVIHRAIIEAVYDYPSEGIQYIELVGEALPGANGESESSAGSFSCTPGDGIACYTGGFALDIPQLAPGGPKSLEITGPIKMYISGGAVTARMDEFPFAIMYLRSSEIPQLPSGVTATLVISGAEGLEATGTFDGSRLELQKVGFRIRVALGEKSAADIKAGISALVDFELVEIPIKTISPYEDGAITLHLETKVPQNPSGNELFDQFLSGAKVTAVMEGKLEM